jgi:hypothetical protein
MKELVLLAHSVGSVERKRLRCEITIKAEKACERSGQAISDHLTHVGEMVEIGSGAQRRFERVYLYGKDHR